MPNMATSGSAEGESAPVLDLASPALLADPYSAFALARRRAPIVPTAQDLLATTTHAATRAVLSDPRLRREDEPPAPPKGMEPPAPDDEAAQVFTWLHTESLLDREPPFHQRLRRLTTMPFHIASLTTMHEQIEHETTLAVQDLAGLLVQDGQVDLVPHLAERVTGRVICALLGIPVADAEQVGAWTNDIVATYEFTCTSAQFRRAQQSALELSQYVSALASRVGRRPGENVLSDLVRQHRNDAEPPTEQEVVATVFGLASAGLHAPANALLNGIATLLSLPEELALLRAMLARCDTQADVDSTLDQLLEEMLRHDAASQVFVRIATEDVVIQGVPIRRGQGVVALIGAANRDPAVFSDPDSFRVGRIENPHLAFGVGLHECLGALLARLELREMLRQLLPYLWQWQVLDAARSGPLANRGHARLVVAPVGSAPQKTPATSARR